MTDPLRGDQIVLRPLSSDDRPALREILAQASVAARWHGTEGLVRTLDGLFSTEDDVPFVITLDGEVVGYIQYGEETETDYRHASIDVFVGERHQGRGIGTDAVRTLARYLVQERGHHRLTIDPAADNESAIRAYTRVGFRPVGIMRQYERGPDGMWHDGLLMDLLAEDLSPRR
jgi:aminoglycoside 6'-N-acetyltransferase